MKTIVLIIALFASAISLQACATTTDDCVPSRGCKPSF
jgi:hypothetical protein